MSDDPTPPYADDDDSDEAAIWRLKQAELRRVDDPDDPPRDVEGPREPIPTSGTIYRSDDAEEMAMFTQRERKPDRDDPLRDPSRPDHHVGPMHKDLFVDQDTDVDAGSAER
ncbi:hypothetical protein GTR02_04015 [Kineococcus sp. R8]|uniref:hypothetical protein n=1 Tax=Kineococcus siccus TaxID=2696567 RepID=UPI0014123F62|nr:hypothetical protein [Kineococcus siccus]NAZ80979.1 hypothetical protein [Kineococcus siccus]